MKLDAFLKRYNINKEKYEQTGLNWDDLLALKAKYERMKPELNSAVQSIVNTLYSFEKNVKYIRYRIKDSEHLIEKIIRKKISKPEVDYNLNNFTEHITDLIGVRILHLFKDDWEPIHDLIMDMWETIETPIAYIRNGDGIPNGYHIKQIRIEEHPYGYRSVHYVIKSKPTKKEYFAEIQVRTLFEEAWSETDHHIRYPYDPDNSVYSPYLVLFNRVAGYSDEMATYLNFLKSRLDLIDKEHKAEVNKLREQVRALEIDKAKKEELETELNKLQSSKQSSKLLLENYEYKSGFVSIENFKTTNYVVNVPVYKLPPILKEPQ